MPRTEFSSSIGVVRVGSCDGDTVLVRVGGEWDVSNVEQVRAALAEAASIGARAVVVDLSAATFVSAAFIGAVVDADEHLRRRGVRLSLRSPSVLAARVLRSCGLDALLDAQPQRPPKVLVGV